MKDKKSFILQEAYTNSIDERKQLYLFFSRISAQIPYDTSNLKDFHAASGKNPPASKNTFTARSDYVRYSYRNTVFHPHPG